MSFNVSTRGFNDIIDITDDVRKEVEKSGKKEGICLVFCSGSTAGITTIEYEEGVVKDLKRILEKIAPMDEDYQHSRMRGDDNGYAHVRSALMKPGMAFPVQGGKLALGTWQQIVLVDFDNRPREREIIVKMAGN